MAIKLCKLFFSMQFNSTNNDIGPQKTTLHMIATNAVYSVTHKKEIADSCPSPRGARSVCQRSHRRKIGRACSQRFSHEFVMLCSSLVLSLFLVLALVLVSHF